MAKSRNIEESKPGQSIGCGNHHFGCGKQMRIIKYHNDVQMVEADGYNPAVHLCIGCSNSISYNWKCAFNDLPFLMTAIQFCKFGSFGEMPDMEIVWKAMEKMGKKKELKHIGVAKFDKFTNEADTEEEKARASEIISECTW